MSPEERKVARRTLAALDTMRDAGLTTTQINEIVAALSEAAMFVFIEEMEKMTDAS